MDESLGAHIDGRSARFLLWAPRSDRVRLHLLGPPERTVSMDRVDGGYHEVIVEGVPAGTRYDVELGSGARRADPASRSQPAGVHGPSEVVDPAFPWTDAGWRGTALEDLVLYELHVGTFTPEGTFDAVTPRLADLLELGVTAVELMPIAQFPGARNWGYDGVFPFAAQASYGGLDGLRRLVDACHQARLACILDVVYNHLGPEGNHLADFASYLTERHLTPWGPGMNLDGPGSDGVRRFFLESALHWILDAHVDGLRLDSIQAITDRSDPPFLEELGEAVHAAARKAGRRVVLIAEDPRNEPSVVRPRKAGGLGLDAVWSDDFHHALHAFLTNERAGYYADFGAFNQLLDVAHKGVAFTGQPSHYWGRNRGRPFTGTRPEQLVVYAQNHDQVGNRARSERLSALAPFEALKLVAAFVLLSPYTPLLFMGEEYGERNPFHFFTDYGYAGLASAVRGGRIAEFRAFQWQTEIPDPQAESTFLGSRLDWERRTEGTHAALLRFHRTLLSLRRFHPALQTRGPDSLEVEGDARLRVLTQHRQAPGARILVVYHFGADAQDVSIRMPEGTWHPVLDSSEAAWGGPRNAPIGAFTSDDRLPLRLEAWEALVLETQGDR